MPFSFFKEARLSAVKRSQNISPLCVDDANSLIIEICKLSLKAFEIVD